ncbi:hypothetical protein EDB87DRAFT_413101, partial [Lactarius vividus]
MHAPLVLTVPVKLMAGTAGATGATGTTGMTGTLTGTSSKSHTSVFSQGSIVSIRGVFGGVAALLVIVATVLVVWRRQRQSNRRTSVGRSSFIYQSMQATLTPFNPTRSTHTEVAPLDEPQTGLQRQLVHRSSSSGTVEDTLLPLRGVVCVPVGLLSKELAWLCSLANGSLSQPIDVLPSN